MPRSRSPLAPEQVGIKQLPTSDLYPNPHNPRRLFDRQPLETLRESIAKVGILVPLTVYWEARKKRFVILDGQRRWKCAQELQLPTVPTNVVAEPTVVQNIVTMFQIHQLREDWELMPTALTLGVLMKELKEKRVKALAELTGLDQAVVVRCKKLLSYSKHYQDMMLDPNPERRVKSDFFIEMYAVISDRSVRQFAWFRRGTFVKQMLKKYNAKGIKAVTDFRLVKQHINNAVQANRKREISRLLKEFAERPNIRADHLAIREAGIAADVRSVLKAVEKLRGYLETLDAQEVYGEEELWSALQGLAKQVEKKLQQADKRRGRR